MTLNEPQNYWIELLEGGSYRLLSTTGGCSFAKPATVRGVAKLYTLSDAGTLIYVGIAKQPMSSRLNFGFKANGESGYHGYKWKNLQQRLYLSVWTAQIDGEYAPLRELETVEAEVVFLCRLQSGRWPLYQHEIHFYPSDELHREAAKTIYNHAVSNRG
jgi:hypothetical protein